MSAVYTSGHIWPFASINRLVGGRRARAKRTAKTGIRIGRVELLPARRAAWGGPACGLASARAGAAAGGGLAGVAVAVQRRGCDGGVGRAARSTRYGASPRTKLRSPPWFLLGSL